jgi:hypothetical protein
VIRLGEDYQQENGKCIQTLMTETARYIVTHKAIAFKVRLPGGGGGGNAASNDIEEEAYV